MTETDDWYRAHGGQTYNDEQVDRWLARWFIPQIELRRQWRVLDLACGDGVWSFGLRRLEPTLSIIGVDLSAGAIDEARARARALSSDARFETGDVEDLSADLEDFDLVFARGLPLFNQHDMTHRGCMTLLESLHGRLIDGGCFFSSYGGRPHLEGQYTPAEEVRLPLNRVPRRTAALDFRGGKFNHSQQSFLAPFLTSEFIELCSYRYSGGRHTCVTAAARTAEPNTGEL